MTTENFTTAASAEAERWYPDLREDSRHEYGAEGFAVGAEWARTHLAAQEETSTLPERFRNPEDLARFVVENEWALESEINPSGRADWKETLGRVYDAWDGDTPEDIVSTIAAAVRLDRSFRAAAQEPTDTEVLAALNAHDPTVSTPNLGHYAPSHVGAMRAALSAARAARRDEEDR